MRSNANLRILVADTLITWGPLSASSVNDNYASDGYRPRLVAGFRDTAASTISCGAQERPLLLSIS